MSKLFGVPPLVLPPNVEELGEESDGGFRPDVDGFHEGEGVGEHELGGERSEVKEEGSQRVGFVRSVSLVPFRSVRGSSWLMSFIPRAVPSSVSQAKTRLDRRTRRNGRKRRDEERTGRAEDSPRHPLPTKHETPSSSRWSLC